MGILAHLKDLKESQMMSKKPESCNEHPKESNELFSVYRGSQIITKNPEESSERIFSFLI